MKITKRYLQQVIKEELQKELNEPTLNEVDAQTGISIANFIGMVLASPLLVGAGIAAVDTAKKLAQSFFGKETSVERNKAEAKAQDIARQARQAAEAAAIGGAKGQPAAIDDRERVEMGG